MSLESHNDSSNRIDAFFVSEQAIVGGGLKRAIDFFATILLLILFSPILIGVALLMKASDKGPVLYRHKRMGVNSTPFYCLKFRTMVTNGDAVLQRHLLANPRAAAEWAEKRKLDPDPRVTAIGAVLRKSSLDELPQLFNVLRGEMSLIGPRPIVADEVKFYGRDIIHYFRARPGLTGAWQTSGRSDVSYDERVNLDKVYVQTWSLWKDVMILLKTIPAVLMAKGSC